ncbi:TPA: hypothetical protein HA274_05595, partial [Candidatus Bathyarchaeota archaeon]|nr:hypothetical protein [Candidatus Bathyarchaeota archaeon]
YVIDVDQGIVQEIDPETYIKRGLQKDFVFPHQNVVASKLKKTLTLLDYELHAEGSG